MYPPFAPAPPPVVTQHVVSTPPADEPFTLDEGKLLAGADWVAGDPREPLMTAWIAAARDQAERDTRLPLLTQTIDLALTGVPVAQMPVWRVEWSGPTWSASQATIALVRAPGRLQAVSWVQYLDANGATQTLDPSQYQVDLLRGTVTPTTGAWPSTQIAIRYTAGWATPADLKAAVPLLVHAVGLLVAHYATLGRDIGVIERGALMVVPQSYTDAIAAFQPVTVA